MFVGDTPTPPAEAKALCTPQYSKPVVRQAHHEPGFTMNYLEVYARSRRRRREVLKQ